MRPPRFLQRSTRNLIPISLLVLGIFASLGTIPKAHAVAPSLVQSATPLGLQDGVSPVSFPGSTTVGDFIAVHIFCMAGGDTVNSVSDAAGSTYTELFHVGRAHVWTGFVKGSTTGIIVNLTCNFGGSPSASYSAEEFSGVSSIGNVVTDGTGCSGACTTTRSITIGTNNALVYNPFEVYGGGIGACPTITNGGSSQITTQTLSCLNGLAGAFSLGRTVYAPNRGIGTNSFSMQTSNSQTATEQLVELDPAGGTPSNLGTQTACYGNCGNPAVTLANTNSTHSINFNQSITLFYEFQSQLNGQVLNVTTSLAKTYGNGMTVTLSIYTIPTCPVGITPFSAQCQGVLQTSLPITNPVKGRQTFNNANVPVSSGQWVGIALTGSIGKLDINDTNTAVQLFQTSGTTPPSISQSTVQSAASLMGLWAYITGNVVSSGGPPPGLPSGCQSFATIDCWLPALVNGFCSTSNQQCQTSSAIFWILILATIFEIVLGYSFYTIAPNLKIPFGEMFIFIILMLTFLMTGLQLVFVWVPVFLFMIGAIIFSKHTGRFF